MPTSERAPDTALTDQQEAPAREPAPAAPGLRGPQQVLALQRTAGNQAVAGMLLARQPAAAPAAPAPAPAGPAAASEPDTTAVTGPFELGGATIATYGDAASALRLWCLQLEAQKQALDAGGVPAPMRIETVRQRGTDYIDLLAGGGAEALDAGNAEDLRAWHADFIAAHNAGQAAQAEEAARRARQAADELAELSAKLDELVPTLRDLQRKKFKGGDEEGALEVADTIFGIIDTGLVAKGAIENTIEVADDLRAWGSRAPHTTSLADSSAKVRGVMDAVERINKVWAAFQLARAGLDLAGGSKTKAQQGAKGVSAMATVISAGGTLLNASAGFTLYANLYIGPMTSACLNALERYHDLVSTGDNRRYIQAGMFEMVAWDLEPGGREMFDFMLALMRASSADQVPTPPSAVDAFLVDYEDDLNAGVGAKGGEMPTEGVLFWEKTDKAKIKRWAFRNRENLWGMLYGAATVPTGRAL